MAERIHRYWGNRYGLSPKEIQQPGVRVVPHARPGWDDDFVSVLLRDDVCVVSVAEPHYDMFLGRLQNVDVPKSLGFEMASSFLGVSISKENGLFYQAYAELEHFRLVEDEAVRTLGLADEDLLDDLRDVCDAYEWSQSGLERYESERFAYFLDDQIVAAARYDLWAADAASIGVITHPQYRGKGYGRAVVSVAMAHALDAGYMVIYQARLNNVASIAISQALGCCKYGNTMSLFWK